MCAKENNAKRKDYISGCCCNGMAEMMGRCFPNVEINSDCFSQMNKDKEKFCCPQSKSSVEEENSNCCRWPFADPKSN